ncbi:MAG: hypothetical protein ACKN9W_20070 [Methylococcus sp.]
MIKPITTGCLLILLNACTATSPTRIAVPFDEAKARSMLLPGSNQVKGRIMASLNGGTLVTCANNVVSLVPVTPYAKEWARLFYQLDTGRYGSLKAAYRMDSREPEVKFAGAEGFYAATRTTRCDEDGDFAFANVANGEFFVVAKTRWLGKDHDYYDFMYGINDAQEEDGSVMEMIRVNGNDAIELQWTPPPPRLLGGEGLMSGR